MDIFISVAHFVYRIRYKLIIGSILAIVLSVYFTNYLPKKWNVSTLIFTGITSKTSLDNMSGTNTDRAVSNNAHDNIITLIKSKSTLEQISLSLLAQHLIYGDPKQDNNYIMAKHYNQLMEIVPKEILALVDKNSVEKTVANLKEFKTENSHNFVYGIFNWTHHHYSFEALQKINVKRRETSDMIEISYKCDDPGIAMNTIYLLNKELMNRYEDLLLSTSNGVIKYFEDQLVLAKETLMLAEDDLVLFNTDNQIINYPEQTKHLAALNNNFEMRYESILLDYQSSTALLAELEQQMDTRANLMRENTTFLSTLEEISTLNGKISEIEIFGTDTISEDVLADYKRRLVESENKIKDISNNIDIYRYSKEGVAIDDMVAKWLDEVIKHEKSRAEIEVMTKRKDEIIAQYAFFSPVGPNLNRKDRGVRVAEESYLTLLHHLGLAYLKQKDILLNSGTLQIITPPEYPLLVDNRRRELYVIASLLAAIVFVLGWYLIIEMIDRTLRDPERTERLTKGKVIGAFPRNEKFKYRGFNDEVRRMAILHLGNTLNYFIKPNQPMIINLLGLDSGEGKSYIADQLQEHWTDMKFSVNSISYENDFESESKQFLQTTTVYDLIPELEQKPDILIVEYDALNNSSIPSALLNEASVNLLIINAGRAWRTSDQSLFNALSDMAGKDSLFIFLNNSDRETVEEFTGQLPPYTVLRKLTYRLFNLGITSRNI